MDCGAPFQPFEINDDDIQWVTDILGLPENAFCGVDGADPRKEVLKDMTTIDVSACPGSGKTTLLVAKLAILANKWQYRTKGICVLSHTNAARDEIEKRIGHLAAGRSLLAYPHFIGTIHGFVDQFLALPWLRSKGYPIKMVDTDLCLSRRWYSLPYGTRVGLEKRRQPLSILSIKTPAFGLGQVKWGKGVLNIGSETYINMQNACRLTTEEGYFCYDEMFMWAEELICKYPGIAAIIRTRFPMLFIDETQDNSELQSKMLYTIFQAGDNPVVRQRFGDENQAIYDFVGAEEASTDKFPLDDRKREVPNSHRFCQIIAQLAGPLGLNADTCSLVGEGPKCRNIPPIQDAAPHTIFLFDDETITRVFDAYGDLILGTFPKDLLRKGVFTAVGQVHRRENDTKRPRHLSHYWSDYEPELCSKEPKPDSFMKYVYAGMAMAQKTMEANPLVEKISEGILRLAGMATHFSVSNKRGYCHRRVLRCLEGHPETIKKFGRIVHEWAVKGNLPTKDVWQDVFSKQIREIAEVIASEQLTQEKARHFLRWQGLASKPLPESEAVKFKDNIYRHTKDGKTVRIRVGSIHSVKGETHTATLVMETFWHAHNLQSIMPWICCDKEGCSEAKKRDIQRLKIHYVAMTRPTHLLCLAMKKSVFENDNGEPKKEILNRLSDRGWRIFLIQ
jgi:DNA helicase II / ATP-dependent DNA helicase PcrA